MSSEEWKYLKIYESPIEIIDGDRGVNYPKQDEFSNDGYCLFLNTGNVTKHGFDFVNTQFITKQKDCILRKGKLKKDDIVFTTRGTVGNVAHYDDSVPYENIRINSGMVIFRNNNPELIATKYFYFFLRSKSFFDQVISHSSGSAQPQLPIKDLREIIVPLPSITTQRRIAEILSALDDKIELNRQTNATLEAMAQAIFDEWFVRFNFPGDDGERVESELGPIPRGWRVGKLGEVCDITMGQSPPGESYNEMGVGLPFFQGRADFTFRFPQKRVFTTDPKRYAYKFDSLVSVRAPVGDMNIAAEDCCIGRGLAAVMEKNGNQSFTYYFLRSLTTKFKSFEDNGTVFGSINRKDFEGMDCIIPPISEIINFEELSRSIDDLIYERERESATLAKIRDALLPKLMNGEIEV